MRIMAIDAGYLSLGQRHVRVTLELGAFGLVTGIAGLVDTQTRQHSGRREVSHRIMAVAAG